MNFFLHRQRAFRRWRWQRSAAAKRPQPKALHVVAAEHIQKEIQWPGNLSSSMRLTALYASNRALAAQIERMRDDLWFRAAAVFPTAALFALLAYRITPVWPLAISSIVGVGTSWLRGR